MELYFVVNKVYDVERLQAESVYLEEKVVDCYLIYPRQPMLTLEDFQESSLTDFFILKRLISMMS